MAGGARAITEYGIRWFHCALGRAVPHAPDWARGLFTADAARAPAKGRTEVEVGDVLYRPLDRAAEEVRFMWGASPPHSSEPHHSRDRTGQDECPVGGNSGCHHQGYGVDVAHMAYIGARSHQHRPAHTGNPARNGEMERTIACR